MKRTTAAFNKHVIRRKTAGRCITDGAVPAISEEGTTLTDGSLFQHLVMHIAQNFIPMLNNQYQQYRCCYFPGSFSAQAKPAAGFDAAQTRQNRNGAMSRHQAGSDLTSGRVAAAAPMPRARKAQWVAGWEGCWNPANLCSNLF